MRDLSQLKVGQILEWAFTEYWDQEIVPQLGETPASMEEFRILMQESFTTGIFFLMFLNSKLETQGADGLLLRIEFLQELQKKLKDHKRTKEERIARRNARNADTNI